MLAASFRAATGAVAAPPRRPAASLARRPAAPALAPLVRAAAAAPSSATPAGAATATTTITFEVTETVPFGQRIAVAGVGGWEAEPVVLEWSEGDVWVGTVGAVDAGSAPEYKLLTVGDDGVPIAWQAGPNRALALAPGAAAVKVADSLAGGADGPVVVVIKEAGAVKEEVPVAAAAPAPVPAAAAPREAAPAPPAPAAAPAAPSPSLSAAVVAAAATAPTASPSLASLTVKELKARCTKAGLPVGGKKADLISRLQGKGA